jgi:hypothetical protein
LPSSGLFIAMKFPPFRGIYGVGTGNRNPLTLITGRSVMRTRGDQADRGAATRNRGRPVCIFWEICDMTSVVIRVALAATLGMAASAASAQTLNQIKSRGVLNCGSNGTLPGFGLPDAQGRWTGLDVDLCKAIAAAIFNDPNKVKFVPLTAKDAQSCRQSTAYLPRSLRA